MKRMRHSSGWIVLLLAWLALSLSVAGLAQEPDQRKAFCRTARIFQKFWISSHTKFSINS